MGHGGGGRLMHELIENMFLSVFDHPELHRLHDGATVPFDNSSVTVTTDSYVVQPLFFPGGDIGSLAVYGTVNDLAMCGAEPLYLSAGFILEEGLPMETLWRVVQSMQRAAQQAGVHIVTGDTKVIDSSKGDCLYINTTGIGKVTRGLQIGPSQVRSGDVVLINGDIGRHGIAVMAAREDLKFEATIVSDCAPLAGVIQDLLGSGLEIHCLRDLTRGGLGAALIEIAHSANMAIHLRECDIVVHEEVRGACELLGMEPLYVANEGRFITILPEPESGKAISIMQKHFPDLVPKAIGRLNAKSEFEVTIENRLGMERILDLPSGEQLPRIC